MFLLLDTHVPVLLSLFNFLFPFRGTGHRLGVYKVVMVEVLLNLKINDCFKVVITLLKP